LAPAPVGQNAKWDKGSWLAYDGDSLIYAHKAKYHEFYAYNLNTDTWGPSLEPMPIAGSGGSKKSKDGGCAVWVDGAVFALKGGNTQEFWMYSPLIEGWPMELDTIPSVSHTGKKKKVNAGSDMAVCDGRIYALKGNKTRDLLRYALPGGGVDALLRQHLAAQRLVKDRGRQTDDESPVTEGIEAFSPRWRSDGAAVILAHDDSSNWSQVYEVEYSGGIATETRIVDIEAHCEEPSYNNAGDMVCFTVDTAGYCQIGAVDLDTSDNRCGDASGSAAQVQAVSADGTTPKPRALGDITIVTSSSYDHISPSFSPSGDQICFVRESEDGDDDVWCVPTDGGSEVQLTDCGSSHADPVWLNETTLVFTHIPDDDFDQIGKLITTTSTETDLTSSSHDHARPDVIEGGTTVCFERFDDDGTHIAKVSASGGTETVLTTGAQDMEAPDWSNEYAIFCARWTGITSAICRVDATNGGYTAITDSSAIRDNPDCWYDQNGSTSYVIFERENWDATFLLGDGTRRKKWGTGIFKAHYREPHDGAMGAGLYAFALERATPNPARSRATICWQVPVLSNTSLKVYNTAGQLVKVLADGKVKPGAYTSVWNGTDTRGRRLANGVYFYALDNGSLRISRKLVLTD
jgi:Tol biopolymer transport system component